MTLAEPDVGRRPPPAPSPGRTGRPAALAALAVTLVLLWAWPPAGVAAALVVSGLLAPWGRSLGERAVITTVVGSGGVAVLLTAFTRLGLALPPVGWRVLVSLALLLLAVFLALPRAAPVWPRVRAGDLLGIAAGVVVAAMMGLPYLTASTPQTLAALLTWWDHSSHLPMFVQVMHTGSWDVGRLAPQLMFDDYPMLHVGLWSVGEWVGGVGTDVAGIDLVRPYVGWFSITTGLVAALLVWSTGLVASAVTRDDAEPARTRAVAVVAASVTAAWCVLGSLTLMADFAFTNFLLAGALCASAVAVSVRSREAMTRVGWFVMPLAVVATAYLYPPLAGGTTIAAVVVLVVVLRHRLEHAVSMAAVGVVCLLATLPSISFLTTPFDGRDPGSIGGGIPGFELWATLVAAPVVVVVLVRARRRIGTAGVAGLLGPMVACALVAVVFAAQAVAAGVPLDKSYYTLKIVYALMLVTLPTAVALAVRWGLRRVPSSWVARRRGVAALSLAGVVALVLVLLATVGTPRVPPQGVDALVERVRATTHAVSRGEVVVTASQHQGSGGWVTVAQISGARPGDVFSDPYSLEAGRTAAGLGGVLTLPIDQVLTIVSAGGVQDPVGAWSFLLDSEPSLRLRIVVEGDEARRLLQPLVDRYGPDRVEVLTPGS